MRGPESDSRDPGIRLTDTGVFVFVSSHTPHTHTYNYEFKNMLNSNQTAR